MSNHRSKIGIGLAALGRPGYINLGHGEDLGHNYDLGAMQDNVNHVLNHALSEDILYFDVARSYGRAEEFLANWLETVDDKSKIRIGSKWGYTYTADWKIDAEQHEVKKHTIDVLKRQLGESRQILGDHLNVYHIHSATLESGVLENTEVLDELWKLRESGVVVGISTSGKYQADTIENALEIKSGNDFLFESFQVTWNVFEQSTTDVLTKVKSTGGNVIIKETLANGRLTDRNTLANDSSKIQVLKGIASNHGINIDAICIAHVMQQDFVDIALSGASTVEQLASNLEAKNMLFTQSEINLLNNLKEESEEYWKVRSNLDWN